MIALCPMLRIAVTRTSASIALFRRSTTSEARYDPVEDAPPDSAGMLRMVIQMSTANTSAGSMLTRRTSSQTSTPSRAAIRKEAPSTSPTLPPVPWREMANPRRSGNFLERAPIAGGW